MSLRVIPSGAALGAEIHGVDLAGGLDDATFAAIHAAFLEHEVLVVREQRLAPADQIAFAARFASSAACARCHSPSVSSTDSACSSAVLASARSNRENVDAPHSGFGVPVSS